MAEAAQGAAGAAGATTEFDATSWLDQATTKMRVNDDPKARARGLDALNQFIQNAIQPGQVLQKDVEANIKVWINAIDQKLTAQTNEILHDPAYQKLEGTWRGLHYLVHQSETGQTLQIRVFNASKDEIRKDLENAVEFDMAVAFDNISHWHSAKGNPAESDRWSEKAASAAVTGLPEANFCPGLILKVKVLPSSLTE